MRRILLFLSVISFATAFAQTPPAKTLYILGSSTSACTGPSTADSCYVNRLKNFYDTRNRPLNVNNLAVGGTNLYNAMPTGYVPPAGRDMPNTEKNISKAVDAHPDAILVNFPSNGFCDFTLTEVMAAFRTMRQAAQNGGVPFYITTTQPRQNSSCYTDPAVVTKMKAIRDSILLQFGQFAINFYDPVANPDGTIFADYNSGDGIHLNNAGHRIFFQQVLAKNMFNNIILPLSFLRFEAKKLNDAVKLEWTTAEEKDLAGFEIQRSTPGADFTKIGFLNAANTAKPNEYQFSDKPGASVNFYRIAGIDRDGKKTFTSIQRVVLNKDLSLSKVFFTGSKARLEIESRSRETIQISITNATGQQLFTQKLDVQKGLTVTEVLKPVSAQAVIIRVSTSAGASDMMKVFIP